MIPASIRHRNPGATALGKNAKRFGAIKSTVLNDGQGNTIATFPTSVDGAAYQFFCLHSPNYVGKTIGDAIARWSGGNHTNDYLAVIEAETDYDRYDYLTKGLVEEPASAIQLAKAMAKHEAGREYPLTDAEWKAAHDKFMAVLRGEKVKVPKAEKMPVDLLDRFAAASEADLGQREIPGKAANPRMIVWYDKAGHPEIKSDEVANCAAAMCCWLEESGCANPKTLLARDFLEYGMPISEPVENCIGVLYRGSPNSWQGHVGRVVKWTATHVWLHGANQGNEVNVRAFPRSQVLGYRLPIPAVRTITEIATDTSVQRKTVGGGATIGVLLWSAWESVSGWATYIYHAVGELVGILPETATTVQTTVASGKVLTESAGMPWPMQLTLLIAVFAIAGGLFATYKRLRTVNPWAMEG